MHLGHALTLRHKKGSCPGDLWEIVVCEYGMRYSALQFILQWGLLREGRRVYSKGHLGHCWDTLLSCDIDSQNDKSREKPIMGRCWRY